jgi:raffinose/stachyose/melibiose transport system substrate-binding protein
MRLAGHEVVEQAIAREIPFTDPVFVRAGELIQEAVAANCFGQGFNGVTDLDAQIVMATGGAAMRTMGDWDYVGLEAANPDILNSLTVINFPSLAEGEGDPTEMIGGTGVAFAISASAPEGTDAALVELFSSDYFVERLLNVGFFPALIGYEDQIESPLKQEIQGLIGQSSYIQLFWDQLLPPALAERHVATTQGLLGMSMTPQEAADIMEQTAVEEIGPME